MDDDDFNGMDGIDKEMWGKDHKILKKCWFTHNFRTVVPDCCKRVIRALCKEPWLYLKDDSMEGVPVVVNLRVRMLVEKTFLVWKGWCDVWLCGWISS